GGSRTAEGLGLDGHVTTERRLVGQLEVGGPIVRLERGVAPPRRVRSGADPIAAEAVGEEQSGVTIERELPWLRLRHGQGNARAQLRDRGKGRIVRVCRGERTEGLAAGHLAHPPVAEAL